MLNMGEYGELYKVADIAVGNTVATTAYPIIGLVAGDSRYTLLDAANGRIKLAKGKHLVKANVGVVCATGAQPVSLYLATRENNTIANVAKSQAKGVADVNSADPTCITSEAIITSTGDTEVLVQIANDGSPDGLTVKSIQFIAIGLDTEPPRPGTP